MLNDYDIFFNESSTYVYVKITHYIVFNDIFFIQLTHARTIMISKRLIRISIRYKHAPYQ